VGEGDEPRSLRIGLVFTKIGRKKEGVT
jgi:hypothetical protein